MTIQTRVHSDPLIVIRGDAILDADGFLHGWCWCAAMPLERRVVEIMMNDGVASAIVASRFRDDLRDRNIGDGYHGFAVALTRALALAGPGCVLSLRDRASGEIFWRKTLGKFGLPDGLSKRIEDVAFICKSIAQSPELLGGAVSPALKFAACLGDLGRYLLHPSKFITVPEARASLVNGHAVTALPFFAYPHYSVILPAETDASETIQIISAVAPALDPVNAELLVLDTGADPRTALLPSIFTNLRYFAIHGEPTALQEQAALAARGEVLVFL